MLIKSLPTCSHHQKWRARCHRLCFAAKHLFLYSQAYYYFHFHLNRAVCWSEKNNWRKYSLLVAECMGQVSWCFTSSSYLRSESAAYILVYIMDVQEGHIGRPLPFSSVFPLSTRSADISLQAVWRRSFECFELIVRKIMVFFDQDVSPQRQTEDFLSSQPLSCARP